MVEEKEYDLKKSIEGLGKLNPILKDAHGNIIDGFHRQEVDPNWNAITIGEIDNPAKLELARLATNFCRRHMTSEEIRDKLTFLIGKCVLKRSLIGFVQTARHRFQATVMFAKIVDTRKRLMSWKRNHDRT
jgi:hypothetical protein